MNGWSARFLQAPEYAAGLALADGNTWAIAPGDERAWFIVSRLREAMQLRPHDAVARWVLIVVNTNTADAAAGKDPAEVLAASGPLDPTYTILEPRDSASWITLPSEDEGITICVLIPAQDADTIALQLMRVSLVICRHTEVRGGLLLHGALAEREGGGVILAGPGGVGKTTASQRLPPPWRSLCDDATLVVRDEQGAYWAHPWPTWSDFMFGGPGGTWDVQHAVPLRGIFFLAQAQEDKVEPFGVGEAVCLLVESAEQASRPMSRGMEENEVRALRLQRFDNVSALAQTVPCYLLRLTQTGGFWHEIERAIAQNSRDAS